VTRRGVAPKGSADCGCGCKDGSCAPPKSPAPSAPARPPAHPAAPDLPLPYEIDRDGRRPVPPGFMEAPGSPQALTRFDIAEEMRRRGFPLARPQGWDGRVVPRALQYADALRPSDGSEGARQRPPPEDLPLTPDFFDELQRRNTARLGDHEILTPNRGGRDRKRAGSLTQVPWGEKFQCEPYEPPAFPMGAVVDCQELALWWSSQPATAIEPPQVQPDSEPLPLDATARADVLVRIRADRARPPAPAAPPQEDAQAPDALEHRGPEPPAPAPPGESCTAAPD